MRLSNGPLKKLIVYWDAIDNSWKQWVIGYDSKLQKQILSSLFNKNLSLYDISIILLIAFFIAAGMITFFILKSTSRIVIDPTQKVYDDFCAKLSKKGLTRNIYEGPMDFSSRAVEKFPQQKSSIELITKIYINLRFKSKHRDKLLEQMKQTLRALKLK